MRVGHLPRTGPAERRAALVVPRGEPGAWVMGVDWLIRWIEHFGREHGLGVTDLKRLRQLANPKPGPVARLPDVVPDLG